MSRTSTENKATGQQDLRKEKEALPKAWQLASIVAMNSYEPAMARLLGWLAQQSHCLGAGFYRIQDDGSLHSGPTDFSGPMFENSTFAETVEEGVRQTISSQTMQVIPVPKVRNMSLVAAPIVHGDGSIEALSVAMVTRPEAAVDTSAAMTAVAYATLWDAEQSHARTRWNLSLTAGTLDLLATIESAPNFRTGSIAMVNAVRDHLRCRGVVLGLKRKASSGCRVTAMSGMAEVDARSVVTRSIEDALDECLVRERLSQFPTVDRENRDSLLAHQKLCHDLQAVRVVSHPLKDSHGTTIGAWLVVDDEGTAGDEASATLLRASSTRIADAIGMARKADAALLSTPTERSGFFKRLLQLTIGVAAVWGVMAIPVPYQIHCSCAAEPEVRRFIVAPHEGLIEKTFVEPGDMVEQGTLLARMDGRDVRWELAGLAAESEQAQKERDSGLLEGDVAAAQRAALELKRIDARKQVLSRQRDQLQLVSPITGIVLDGHLDRVENAPVTIGQALYEVAPLSPVTVEIAISDDEYSNVETGDQVAVHFDGIDEEFQGTIERMHPRSEVREGENVFIAEVVLNNAENRLRPGMNGYARIHGRTHSLGWNLFHKPWEHLQKNLPF